MKRPYDGTARQIVEIERDEQTTSLRALDAPRRVGPRHKRKVFRSGIFERGNPAQLDLSIAFERRLQEGCQLFYPHHISIKNRRSPLKLVCLYRLCKERRKCTIRRSSCFDCYV